MIESLLSGRSDLSMQPETRRRGLVAFSLSPGRLISAAGLVNLFTRRLASRSNAFSPLFRFLAANQRMTTGLGGGDFSVSDNKLEPRARRIPSSSIQGNQTIPYPFDIAPSPG
jgi:hypothetical protein